jgi:hypothetical protein
MFSVGQRVWLRTGQTSGRVLECDGGRVYIEQDNGVELDFPATDLTADPPTGTKASAKPSAAAALTRTLTPRDITPDHERVLATIPIRTLKAIAALYERSPSAGRFSALDTAAKLNAITAITAVPYRIMHQYSDRPGELSLLMGKGLADSGTPAQRR